MGAIGNANDLLNDLEKAEQGINPLTGEPNEPPGIPFPTQEQLGTPSIDMEVPAPDWSGKIATDESKWAQFPLNVGWCQDGYRERWSNEGDQEISLCAEVPWGSVQTFKEYCLGYSYVAPVVTQQQRTLLGFTQNVTVTIGQLYRIVPLQCPKPGCEHLYCHSYEVVEPEGYVVNDPNILARDANRTPVLVDEADPKSTTTLPWPAWADRTTAQAGLARVKLTFRPRRDIMRNNSQMSAIAGATELTRYIERDLNPTLQSLGLPASSVQFADGSGAIPTSGTFLLLPCWEITYTWRQVPSPPWDSFKAVLGTVNQNAFDSFSILGSAFPSGTLLCVAPKRRWEVRRQCTGLMAWECYYSFLYRPQGWNYYPNAAGQFVAIQMAVQNSTTKKPVYSSGDFDSLFKVAAPVQWD